METSKKLGNSLTLEEVHQQIDLLYQERNLQVNSE
jgi:hypothetical protein